MPSHHSPSGVTHRATARKHPPPFDQIRPSAFSSNLSWGRPTARLRAWRRNHPRIVAQRYLKPYCPPPPVPVENGVCRSNRTWVIPMRRNLLLRSGREDCGQPRFSEPAPTCATYHDQECQSHRGPSCKAVDEVNIVVRSLQIGSQSGHEHRAELEKFWAGAVTIVGKIQRPDVDFKTLFAPPNCITPYSSFHPALAAMPRRLSFGTAQRRNGSPSANPSCPTPPYHSMSC